MPAERPLSKASENRRATKPIMEKRRRARINQCLTELKTLILDALNKDPSRHSKLEKADILEMTVRHLQNIQRQQMAAAISTDSSVLNKFKAGFSECATEVSRYVSRIEGVDPALRQRLLSHLSNCLTTMNSPTTHFQQQTFPSMLQSLSVQIPAGIPIRSSTSDMNNNTPSPTNGKVFAGLSVIPSRLPNGEFAFLLPSQSIPGSFHLPSVSASSSLPSSSGPDRNSQSSWSPTSPSSKRSASPDAMSEDNVVLSPTCSDAGSDVFIEPYHQPKPKEIRLSPVPLRMHRSMPRIEREMVTSPIHRHRPSSPVSDRHRDDMVALPIKDRHEMVTSPIRDRFREEIVTSPVKDRHEMATSPISYQTSPFNKDRYEIVLSAVPEHVYQTPSTQKERHEVVVSPVTRHIYRSSSPHRDRYEVVVSPGPRPLLRQSLSKESHIHELSRHQQIQDSENVWRPW